MQSLPYYAKRPSQGMVWQTTTKDYNFVPGVKQVFVNNFVEGQRHKHCLSNLLNIKQGENKSLQTFISCFNKETLLVNKMDDKILLAAFYNRVTSDLFIHKLYDQEP